MIPAAKSALFSYWFSGHVRRRLRRSFSAIYMEGIEHLATAQPTILFANHSAWWDSLVCFDVVFRSLGRDGYAMMDACGLERVPLLRWIGGFGVRLGDKVDGERALAYAAALLQQPRREGRLILMFPQGREVPHSLRPLGFKPGLSRLSMRVTEALVIPMAIRYEHGRDEKPFILVSIGPKTRDFEAAMLSRLGRIQEALHDGSYRHWTPYLPRQRSRWLGA